MARHLMKEERDRIAQLCHQGFEQKEIARWLGRSQATICRELQRNGTHNEYLAAQAQELAERRRRERPVRRKMDDPKTNDAVREGLVKYWSPEQIAGRMKIDEVGGRRVSARTIYDWLRKDEDADHWRTFLRQRGKRPARPRKPAQMGDPIEERPEAVEQRLRLGDFEGDTVLGPPGTGGLATLVDRKSRYTIIVKIRSKDAHHVHQKIKQRLKELDEERRRSITFDNGREFARCPRLERHLGTQLYFAKPGCPHQRGTNENTNGLIRQYFPKGCDFRDVTHHQVRKVENLLNNRPRACLGFLTPNEVFLENCVTPDCV